MSDTPDRQRTLLGDTEVDPAQRAAHRSQSRYAVAFAASIARLLQDRHLEQIVVFDLHGLSDITDCIVIATGISERQILSVGREVVHFAADQNVTAFGRQSDVPASWSVIDFVDVVVHLFNAEMRAYYDLEMMWNDAPTIEWCR